MNTNAQISPVTRTRGAGVIETTNPNLEAMMLTEIAKTIGTTYVGVFNAVTPANDAGTRRFVDVVRSAFGRFTAWRARRVTVRQLSALNDRMLRDIGIERMDIDAVAHTLRSAANDNDARRVA